MDTTGSQEKNKTTSVEEEIKELQAKLEAKKQEAAVQGTGEKEKEVFREVLKEHIQSSRSAPSAYLPPLPSDGVSTQTPVATDDQAGARREEEVRALIQLALTKSIADAVRMAEKESPYLLDELHAHLVDDYYDKLVALRKINTF